MAKLNTRTARCIARLVEPKSGLSIAVRNDGKILIRVGDSWKRWRKLKASVSPEEFVEKRLANGWIKAVPPTFASMRRWANSGVARAVDGCWVEPDGTCPHGYKSWLLIKGFI